MYRRRGAIYGRRSAAAAGQHDVRRFLLRRGASATSRGTFRGPTTYPTTASAGSPGISRRRRSLISETDSGAHRSVDGRARRRAGHYDIQHNILRNSAARRPLWSRHPRALAYRLFPEAHVRSRQSQLGAADDGAAARGAPPTRHVLYLPPLWLHRVTAGAELSVSVNRFQDSRENAGARARRAGLPPALQTAQDDLPFPSRVALSRFGSASSSTARAAAPSAGRRRRRHHRRDSCARTSRAASGCSTSALAARRGRPRSARRAPAFAFARREARARGRRPRRSTSGSLPAAAAPAAGTRAAPPTPPRPTTRRGAAATTATRRADGKGCRGNSAAVRLLNASLLAPKRGQRSF